MDSMTVVLVLGSIWSIIGGAYVILTYKHRYDAELEEFRQSKISERASSKPQEWWQQVIVNLTNNPEVVKSLLPLVNNATLQPILQNLMNQYQRR